MAGRKPKWKMFLVLLMASLAIQFVLFTTLAAEPVWIYNGQDWFPVLGAACLFLAFAAACIATAIGLENLRRTRLRNAGGYALVIVMIA